MKIMIIYLLIAHFLGDFCLQTDAMVAAKCQRKISSPALYLHAAIVAALSWLLIGNGHFWPYVLILVATHVVIDYAKTLTKCRLWPLVLDQAAHIAVIFGIAWMATQHGTWLHWGHAPDALDVRIPALVCAVIFCTSPANILIREILAAFKVNTTRRSNSASSETSHLRNPGALIGMLERLLILFFVLSNNYEAAGLTVAAKSLLRFRDDEGPRAEFVLVGTLLSFTIAVGLAALLLTLAFGKNIVS